MIAILDTGGANLASLQNAFDRIGAESKVSSDRAILDQASHLILPGVGHAKVAMEKLMQTDLVSYIQNTSRPLLGICLGMQLLYSELDEGDAKGLGILPGHVEKLKSSQNFPVPHMGWTKLTTTTNADLSNFNFKKNDIEFDGSDNKSLLLNTISSDESFYFVHSYLTPMNDYVTSYVDSQNSSSIPATLEFKNFFGTQFHPEKSGPAGEQLLNNFLKINL